MRFSLFSTALAFAFLQTSLALGNDVAGGVLVADKTIVPETLLEPFIKSNPLTSTTGDELQKREPTVIEGLLHIRQSCPTGYGLCNNGRCCPLGGQCCSSKTSYDPKNSDNIILFTRGMLQSRKLVLFHRFGL